EAQKIVFSPDGKTLALAISYSAPDPSAKTRRSMVKLWDVAKNQTLAELPNWGCVRFMAGSRYLDWRDVRFVAGGRYLLGQRRNDRQGQILLYDLDTKEDRNVFTCDIPLPNFASSEAHVLGAADGRFLLCCFHDGRVVKLDLPSGKVVAEQKATTKDTRSYSDWTLSGDGRFLAGNVRTLLLPRVGFANLPEDWEEARPPEITI